MKHATNKTAPIDRRAHVVIAPVPFVIEKVTRLVEVGGYSAQHGACRMVPMSLPRVRWAEAH